jgi:hypothetical protein
VPYWYGERTLTGFLNAAAWKSRGLALEESAAARGPVRKPRAGRIDSYIVLGKPKTWYQIEAKVAWPSKPGAKGLQMAATYVRRELNNAEEQLYSPADDYYGDFGLALCFIVPELYWSTRKLPRQVDTAKLDSAGTSGLGRKISGGTRPRLSWGRSVL